MDNKRNYIKDKQAKSDKFGSKKWGSNHNLITSLIASIIIIGLIAGVSIAYNFLGGFYYCRVVSFDKMLGEEQNIFVDSQGAFSCAANFSGSLVVGADIRQPIYVEVGNVSGDLYLRAKAVVNGFDSGVNIMGYSNWSINEDGYIYLNQPVKAFEKVGVCNLIKMNMQMELKSSSNYIIIFTVEARVDGW